MTDEYICDDCGIKLTSDEWLAASHGHHPVPVCGTREPEPVTEPEPAPPPPWETAPTKAPKTKEESDVPTTTDLEPYLPNFSDWQKKLQF